LYQGTASQAAEKVRFERFVTGRDFSRADKPFIFLPEPALAGGTGPCFDFFRSLFSRAEARARRSGF